jgi:hypothetical protein
VWAAFKLAMRAAIWRTTHALPLVGLPSLLGWTAVLALVRVALQYLTAGSSPNFNPYGLNAVVAWLAVELAVAALFVRPMGRATALSAMFVLSIIADVAGAIIKFGATQLASVVAVNAFWSNIAAGAVFIIAVVWWLGAMMCILRSLELQSRPRLFARAAALWMALIAANAVMPHAPVFIARDFDVRSANWWDFLRARTLAENSSAEEMQDASLEKSQAALLQAEVATLAPQRSGATDIFVIGVAGWADQGVFVKELDGALAAIGSVLPIKDRIVRLVNQGEMQTTAPLGTGQNFAAAVHAVGQVMDKDEDVLILLMTSHGDRNGFALELPDKTITELTPQQVAEALDNEGIKNRVVIISACYAGIFLPPLANDNTIVMTAADDKHTSFGCAPERDWTYFGDALFRQSLQPGADFQHAFDHARVLIQGWELMDHVPPSNPQGHFGPLLVGKLEPLFQSARTAAQ